MAIPREHETELRVRYHETDAQGRAHHGAYVNYFETARVELLRAGGLRYRDLEARGWLLVVAQLRCRYYRPAYYDDLLRVVTRITQLRGARMEIQYQVLRENEVLAEGETTIACVNRQGKPRRLPAALRDVRPPRSRK